MDTYNVCKFGGTSVATREQIEKVLGIVVSDPTRRFVVVSAPGKINGNGTKVTDILLRAADGQQDAAEQVKQRIREIAPDIPEEVNGLCENLDGRLAAARRDNYRDNIAAFGEFAVARVITTIMNKSGIPARFYDPRDIGFIATSEPGNAQPDPNCFEGIGRVLLSPEARKTIAVIPGFYAYTRDGKIVTLPRGGSDTTGAVIANAVNASVYENWTDEDGLRGADPCIVTNAKIIREITYREVRELAYMGFKIQMEAVLPLIPKHIPLHVRNTNNPTTEGTFVVYDRIVPADEYIVGVAARPGYIIIDITKGGMNREVGFGHKIFKILADNGVSYEHSPTGIDNISVVVERDQVAGPRKINKIIREFDEKCGPLDVTVGEDIAMVGIVGRGMRLHRDTDARVFGALARQGIEPRVINKGASTIGLFIGVRETEAHDAVRAVYTEFYGK